MTTENSTVLGIGIIGLGGAAVAMIPRMAFNPRFKIIAAADLDTEILGRFARDFPDAATHTSAEEMCKDPRIDLVYIATPTILHSQHCELAMSYGKHVLIEKPMTINVEEGTTLAESAERQGVLLGVNVKHSFEPRVLRIREMVRTGEFGELRMMHHWRYQGLAVPPALGGRADAGPRRRHPLAAGAAPVRHHPHDRRRHGAERSRHGFRVGPRPPRAGRACGVPGVRERRVLHRRLQRRYDHWDSREFMHGVGQGGHLPRPREARRRAPRTGRSHRPGVGGGGGACGAVRSRQAGPPEPPTGPSSAGWLLGGPLMVSFDDADVRLSPGGLTVYGNKERSEIPLVTVEDGRDGRLNTFYDAITTDRPLPANARWGNATIELLLAVEQSGEERKEIFLEHQTPTVD